jgi:hypothetical protein
MSEDWSDAELEIAVHHYWKAHAQKGAERELDRSAFIKAALKAGLKSRGEGAVQRRMCNISAVMEANQKPWVIGWPPLRNVGTGVTPRIEALLKTRNLI